MRIVFFVGNGFDIACGIKTSYTDFYEWYYKLEKSDKEYINSFRNTIKADIEAGKENWADFEQALGQYTNNFTKETAHEFIECFEDAHAHLMQYLESQAECFQYDFSEETIKMFREGIKSFYSELNPKERNIFEEFFKLHRDENRTVEFISYNYTNTLDRIISVASKEPLDTWTMANGRRYTYSISPNIIHAHGFLNHHPIFGVNDETQIANKILLETRGFSRLMIKHQCVETLGELWHDEVVARINNASIIAVYGMSMGITDSLWFSKIMEWLKQDESRQLIIFWYTRHPSDGISNWQTFSNKWEAQEKIIDHSDYTAQDIVKISPRIHVVENSEKVLQIRLKEKEMD